MYIIMCIYIYDYYVYVYVMLWLLLLLLFPRRNCGCPPPCQGLSLDVQRPTRPGPCGRFGLCGHGVSVRSTVAQLSPGPGESYTFQLKEEDPITSLNSRYKHQQPLGTWPGSSENWSIKNILKLNILKPVKTPCIYMIIIWLYRYSVYVFFWTTHQSVVSHHSSPHINNGHSIAMAIPNIWSEGPNIWALFKSTHRITQHRGCQTLQTNKRTLETNRTQRKTQKNNIETNQNTSNKIKQTSRNWGLRDLKCANSS